MGRPVVTASAIKETPVTSPSTAPSTAMPGSPFLSTSGPEEKPSVPVASSWVPPTIPKLKPLFGADPQEEESQKTRKKMVYLALAIGTLLLAFGFVAWYFIFRSSSVVTDPQEAVPSPEEKPVVSVVLESPFSLQTPNYLSIDTESITANGLQEILRQSAERIMAAHIGEPVEFLLTDKNNNPLAFSRFSYLMQLDIKPEILSSLGEPFSLFLYNDQGIVLPGLKLSFVVPGGVAAFENQKETTLPFAFRSILFPGRVVAKEVVFRSGVYNTETVRFVNIDMTGTVSFDYVVRGNDWFIGSSKDTLRAMLDKKR